MTTRIRDIEGDYIEIERSANLATIPPSEIVAVTIIARDGQEQATVALDLIGASRLYESLGDLILGGNPAKPPNAP